MLITIPSGALGSEAVSSTTQIAGLPLLLRIVLAARQAGFSRILIHPAAAGGDGAALAGTTASVLTPDGRLPALARGRIVLLAANVVPQVQWLRSLLETPVEPERLYADGSAVAVIETGRPDRILAEAARCDGASELFKSLRQTYPTAHRSFGERGWFTLTTPQAVPKAEAWLLAGLIKEAEGFMSRHVERRLSLALTRRLAPTRITPNVMTVVSLGVGLLGAPFFLSQRAAYQLPGALLLLLHSILDGCDGELARLKFQESRLGSLLDFWGDNVVHVAVMAGIAIGWSLAIRAVWPLLLGGVAAASVLLTATVVYRLTRRETTVAGALFQSDSGTRPSWLHRAADLLARRDFIYLVVLLSAAGKATWFLVLAAVGTPLFLLALVWIARADGQRKDMPA